MKAAVICLCAGLLLLHAARAIEVASDRALLPDAFQVLDALEQKLAARPEDARRLRESPSLSCDACTLIGSTLWDAVVAGGQPLQDLENLVNDTCHAVVKDALAADLCADIFDDLLGWMHKKANGITWNLTEIACADLLKVCTVQCCVTQSLPEQIHLSFTGGDVLNATTMQVAWVTSQRLIAPAVQWWPAIPTGDNTSIQTAAGASRTYTPGGWLGWIHGAVMTGLQPDTTYTYTVGSPDGGWSAQYNFTTLPLNAGTRERPLRVVSYGDMGIGGKHWATIELLKSMVDEGKIDFILHTGDISYADADEYRWDRYLREMEPIAARVPYMTCPGNHELPWNFTAYKARFFMPAAEFSAPDDATYYSFSAGKFRFVLMDTEAWYDLPMMDPVQKSWAGRVLTDANQLHQFLFVGFHRPLYCSSTGGLACSSESEYLRKRLEDLLFLHKVGVIHTGHVHNYERTYPIFNGSAVSLDYNDTKAPVHFVNGGPGCDEGLQSFGRKQPSWSVARVHHVGFMSSRMWSEETADGKRRFTFDSVMLSSENRTVLDHVTFTKVLA